VRSHHITGTLTVLATTAGLLAGGIPVASAATSDAPQVRIQPADDPTATATATPSASASAATAAAPAFGPLTCSASQTDPFKPDLTITWKWPPPTTDRIDVYIDGSVPNGGRIQSPQSGSYTATGLSVGGHTVVLRGARTTGGADTGVSCVVPADQTRITVKPPVITSCALLVEDPNTGATGLDRVKPQLRATWSALGATDVDIRWLIDGTETGKASAQTAGTATTAVGPFAWNSTAPRQATAEITPRGPGGTGTSCVTASPTAVPRLPAPPGALPGTQAFDFSIQPDGRITVGISGTTGLYNVSWISTGKGTHIFDKSFSPTSVTCPTSGSTTVTLTLTPTQEFAPYYSTISNLKQTTTKSCTAVTINKLFSDPGYSENVFGAQDAGVIAFGASLNTAGVGADAEFVDWADRVLTSPLSLGPSGTDTAPVPSGTEARCIKEVRAGNPTGGLQITAAPLTGPYNEANDKAYCEAAYPIATTGPVTPSVPGGGTSVITPTSGPSSSGPASSTTPATTGGGGASSASAGAYGSLASGGPGAAPGVRVFTSKCLADEAVYADMAGSVGSSFVMAPDLRNRAIPGSFAVTSGSLPAGIQLDTAAGVIYGVPTRTDSGATPITITATNPDGTTTASTFSFRVDDPHHSVSYPVRVIAGLNEPVDVYHHGKGNSGPTSYSLVCGTMPDGLRLDPRTGVISGTPTIQVQYPIPLRIRQVDDHGWVDSSMMLLVDGTTNPWLTYPHHVTVAKGTTRTIRPTVVGLPAATYELVGNLPRGMTLDPATGAITGRPAAVSKKPAEVSVLAMLPDGTVAASDTLLITVRKRAIPMAVTAAPARTVLRDGQVATLVSKVKHARASKLTAKVMCAGCTHTFNKATGKLTVRPGAKTASVKVTVTATPTGAAAKAKFRPHMWSRSWKVAR